MGCVPEYSPSNLAVQWCQTLSTRTPCRCPKLTVLPEGNPHLGSGNSWTVKARYDWQRCQWKNNRCLLGENAMLRAPRSERGRGFGRDKVGPSVFARRSTCAQSKRKQQCFLWIMSVFCEFMLCSPWVLTITLPCLLKERPSESNYHPRVVTTRRDVQGVRPFLVPLFGFTSSQCGWWSYTW